VFFHRRRRRTVRVTTGELTVDGLTAGFLEASPGLHCTTDGEGRLVWRNDAVVSTTGDDETLADFDAMRLVAPDQRADARDAFEHAELFPDDATVTFDLLTADGERIPYDFNGMKTKIDGETVVVVGRDVSSRDSASRDRDGGTIGSTVRAPWGRRRTTATSLAG
jgi:PAS domain-containing protein